MAWYREGIGHASTKIARKCMLVRTLEYLEENDK